MTGRGTNMLKTWGVFVIVCAVLVGPEAGLSADQGERLLCAEDIARHCRGLKPGGGRIINCLKDHEAELSADCRAKIEEVRSMISRIEKNCSAEIGKHCSGIEPGGGRIARCLKEKEHEISDACRETLRAAKVLTLK